MPSSTLEALDLAQPKGADEPYFMGEATIRALQGGGVDPKTNHVDYRRANSWLRAHRDPECRAAALAILQNIVRIPEAGLQQKFVAIAAALEDVAATSDVPLVGLDTYQDGRLAPKLKSTDWMLAALNERHQALIAGHVHAWGDDFTEKLLGFEALRGSAPARRAHDAARGKARGWATWRGQTIDLVILDDASYSGSQLNGYIKTSLDRAQDAGVEIRTVWVGLTAATSYALSMFDVRPGRDARRGWTPFAADRPVRLLTQPIRMATVDEAIRAHGGALAARAGGMADTTAEKTLDHMARMYFYDHSPHEFRRITLSYLPHKLPDSASCLETVLADGHVADIPRVGDLAAKPFIPATCPPYKERTVDGS